MSRPAIQAAAVILVALLAAAHAPAVAAAPSAPALTALAPADRASRQAADLASVAVWRAGLARTVAYAQEHPGLFPAAAPPGARLLTAAERDAVRSTWRSVLDYTFALEAIERYHGDFYRLADPKDRARSFHAARGAFLASYRFALEFIGCAEGDPKLGVILNDPVEELGVPAGSYDRYKFRFLNVAAATRFAAYAAVAETIARAEAPETAQHAGARQDDARRILAAGRGRGAALTAANAVDVLRQLGSQAVFPIQAGVSTWMGDTKVLRRQRALVSPDQIEELRRLLLPGDIMLQRREWYLSNVGLPGFWSHAALYVGTPAERRAFFGAEADVEQLLDRTHPRAYADAAAPHEQGHLPRVIEAISEGVSFTTLEHSAAADSVVVLRPRLGRRDIAAAIARAFAYAGRPYDFNFDFQTDSALVCTELVYKAFEPSPDAAGLRLRLEEILGRTAIPANAIARQFDDEYGTPGQQFDMVAFLDGQERAGAAVRAGVGEFRLSWRRPKWHVLVQQPPDADPATPAAP